MSARISFQIADAQCACRAERDGVCRPKCSLVYNQYITGWHCVHDRSSDHKTVQGKLITQ